MKILFISFYFEPDLSAGSFRNTSLFKELHNQLKNNDFIHVITTQPNRYKSFKTTIDEIEKGINYEINRIKIPDHRSGMIDQAKSFSVFYTKAKRIVKARDYDLVYTSSSRLFSAFLGKRIAASKNIPLYLDIRDIFTDTIKDILKNKKTLQLPVLIITKIIEQYTFANAKHINLVSEGFRSYFIKYPKPTYSFYTNGIDDEFTSIIYQTKACLESQLVITYAGNIGSGQGLEKIVPFVAKKLGQKYLFRIIGDGGQKELLINKLKELQIRNVEIINPVPREELIEYYKSSTFLFLHLNDLDAFKKVLPSKIFEYGSFDKPIIAGVNGYAADFIKQNLSNYILFNPTDTDDFVNKIEAYTLKFEKRNLFIKKFTRKNIMIQMAQNILSVIPHSECNASL